MEIQKEQCEIGIIGLGVMGRSILLNISDKGFSVAGYDSDVAKVKTLQPENKDQRIYASYDLVKFISSLRTPRAVVILVPAGTPVDSVIANLQPLLKPGDILIDAGNSFFEDTDRRSQMLEEKGILFIGMGISGGKEGARYGPSIMPGGNKEAYERVHPILEAISAKVNNKPCVAYLGNGSVGHYVKMIHNGIEYAMMQLIAETYDLMKRGLCLSNNEIHDTFYEWNQGELNSYLLEITAQIFKKKDPKTENYLIDEILDIARQNGTGYWASANAMDINIPTPTIDVAVTMRNFSALHKEREIASKSLHRIVNPFEGDRSSFLIQLSHALQAAMIIAYAQGFSIISKASELYGFHLNLATVAQVWRGGCIIRAALLEIIMKAFNANNSLPSLLLDPELSKKLNANEKYLRQVISMAIKSGVPVPGFMSSLAYVDSLRSRWLPANLIQAQRDYFGDHNYERYDSQGSFHTKW